VGDAGLDFIISDFYEVCCARTVCLTSALNRENAGYLLRKQTRTRQGKHGNARSAANNVLLFVQKTDLRSTFGLFFCKFRKEISLSFSLSLSLSEINQGISNVANWMSENGLSLNPKKTMAMIMGTDKQSLLLCITQNYSE